MSEINYDDKVDLVVDTGIDDIFKVTASDMNEIKNVVNGNADEVGDITTLTTTDKTSVVNAVNELNAPEKWVAVGATAPTDGRRVWFAKSKNLINLNTITTKSFINSSGLSASSDNWSRTDFIKVQPNTTYTLSGITNTGTVAKNAFYSNQDVSSFISAINSTEYTFTTPNNANYVRLSLNSETPTSAMLEEGSTATTYEPYMEKSIKVDNEEWYSKPKVLYENSTGATTGTITLNDSVANYSCVDVVFSIDSFSENVRNYIRMEKYNTTQIFGNLISGQVDGGGNLRVWATRITISGTTATLDRDICLSLNTSGISSQTSRIKVVKVIGYK